jgi:hypothetical protein
MRDYQYDHVHLRSPDPEATARFFETMFGAEVTRSVYPPGTLYPGQQRITMRLGGQKVLIAPPHPHEPNVSAPPFPHYGLEHIGLTVDDVDAAVDGCAPKVRKSPSVRLPATPACDWRLCVGRKASWSSSCNGDRVSRLGTHNS